MKSFVKPLAAGLMFAAVSFGTGSLMAQNTSGSTLQELQATLVELETKLQLANPANTNYVAELNQAISSTKEQINANIAANTKAPEQTTEVVDHTPNTNVQVADPNWVPSFISTGNPEQDAAIIHQYKVAKGLEKDEE